MSGCAGAALLGGVAPVLLLWLVSLWVYARQHRRTWRTWRPGDERLPRKEYLNG